MMKTDIIRDKILKLREEFNKKISLVLDELDVPPYILVLGTDLEYWSPYLLVSNIKIPPSTIENYISNPTSHSCRFFIENTLQPLMIRCGSLICPVITDIVNGPHNSYSFSTENLTDAYDYYLSNREEFKDFVYSKLLEISNSKELKKRYNITNSDNDISLNSSELLKREILVEFLKQYIIN